MSVTEIQPGRLVKVEPDELDAKDVLELGEALIEEHGWVQQTGGDETIGWSIHGAVGEAAKRATGEHGKDGARARPLRDEAARLVAEAHGGATEIAVNDNAGSVGEVLAAMRAARGVTV